MRSKIKAIVRVSVVLSFLFLNINILMAVAFPFREFSEGDPVPDVQLNAFDKNDQAVSFSTLKGKPFVAVFWGADLPEKRDRSIQLLQDVGSLAPFLKERKIELISVNVQGDDATTIQDVVSSSQSDIKVYLDQDRKAYGTLGIFVMPTVLLVDKNGNVAAGMGYSRDLVDRLRGSVEIMLGEKTPEQVQAELRPEMIEATDEEKAVRRHFDYGLVMLKRGQLETAIRELNKAVEVDPNLAAAHIELACVYLETDRLDDAEKSVNKALEVQPDAVRALICRSELKRRKGMLDDALKDIQETVAAHPSNSAGYYVLGKVYQDQKKDKDAMSAFKKAYQLMMKESVSNHK